MEITIIKGNEIGIVDGEIVAKTCTGCKEFTWFNEMEDKINVKNWNNLIRYLSNENGLSVDKFKEFVNWCEQNRRNIEDIDKDKSSIELWNESVILC